MGHANLLFIIPILLYVLTKWHINKHIFKNNGLLIQQWPTLFQPVRRGGGLTKPLPDKLLRTWPWCDHCCYCFPLTQWDRGGTISFWERHLSGQRAHMGFSFTPSMSRNCPYLAFVRLLDLIKLLKTPLWEVNVLLTCSFQWNKGWDGIRHKCKWNNGSGGFKARDQEVVSHSHSFPLAQGMMGMGKLLDCQHLSVAEVHGHTS